jgi:hypothetical protein
MPRFRDNHDGTITDNQTGLVWLRDGFASGETRWDVAKTWCSSLASGTAGLTDNSSAGDWRMPTIDELSGLIRGWSYYYFSPAAWLDSQGFTNTQQDDYWASDSYNLIFLVHCVDFKYGKVDIHGPIIIPTRPVRAKACPASKTLGADNPLLENLRAFRDSTLARSAIGRKVIRIYYDNAANITAALDRSPALTEVTRRVLEVIASFVGKMEE